MEKEHFYVKLVGWIFDTSTRKILIGKNPGDKNYSFLESDLHQDEELDTCLKRMVTEKTGYQVHNLGSMYAENKLQDPTKLKIHFLCEIAGGKMKPGKNVEEMIWIEPKEVENKLGVKLPSRLHATLMNLQGNSL